MDNPENNVKLVVKIDYSQPIELSELTAALNSLTSLYQCTTNRGAKLFVKEIRKSSIEFDLITNYWNSTVPLISDANTIVQFCQYIRLLISLCLSGKMDEGSHKATDQALPVPTNKNYREFGNFVNLMKNPQDSCSISAQEMYGNTIYQGCTFNGVEAKTMKEHINGIMDENENYIRHKQLFKWVQTNFDNKDAGNRGIIENICKKPLKVTFDNPLTKLEMTTSNDDVDWQKKFYEVDAEIQFADGKPKVYKILRNYPEETFVNDD